MFRWLLALQAALLLLVPSGLLGQELSNKGRDFWFAMPNNGLGIPTTLQVYISADRACTATVSIPGQGRSQTVNLAANTTQAVNLFGPVTSIDDYLFVLNRRSNEIATRGVRVTATDSVTVFAINYTSNSSDAMVVYPVNALGYEYYAITRDPSIGAVFITPDRDAYLLVAATEDNTELEIVPTAIVRDATGGLTIPAGTVIRRTLNRGQTYQLLSSGDLTGTRVRAVNAAGCKPFAAFSGNNAINVCTPPGTGAFCGTVNLLLEQLQPPQTWGTRFVSIPSTGRRDEVVTVLPLNPNTQIRVNGVVVATQPALRKYDVIVTGPTVIETSGPASLMQYSTSQGSDGNGIGDPYAVVVSPFEQKINRALFNAFDIGVFGRPIKYYLTIIARTLARASVKLDGATVPAAAFSAVPAAPELSFARVEIAAGNHLVTSDSGFVAYVYAYGDNTGDVNNYEAYGYSSGTNLGAITTRIEVTPFGEQCFGTPLNFTATSALNVQSWRWDFGDGTTATGPTVTNKRFNRKGTYRVRVRAQIVGSCVEDTASVLIRAGGLGLSLERDTSICAGKFLTLTSQRPADWIRVRPNGQTVSLATNTRTPGAFTAEVGTNLFVAYTANCRDTVKVIGTQLPPLITSPTSPARVCVGDSVVFRGREVGYWYLVRGGVRTRIAQLVNEVKIGFPLLGTDVVRLVNCGDSSQVQVQVLAKPIISATGLVNDTLTLCRGSVPTLTGTRAGNWILQSGAGYNTSTTIGTNVAVLNSYAFNIAGTYRLLLRTGCDDTIYVRVNPTPVLTLNTDGSHDPVCNATIQFRISGALAPYSWTWTASGGGAAPAAGMGTVFKQTQLPGGTYRVTVTDARGCTTVQQFVVNDTLRMTPTLRPATCGQRNGAITLAVAGGRSPYTYTWTGGAGTGNRALAVRGGSYQVTVRDAAGCQRVYTLEVPDLPEPTLTLVTVPEQPVVLVQPNVEVQFRVVSDRAVLYEWSFGDGRVATTDKDTISNRYPALGTYPVRVVVQDTSGCAAEFRTEVRVLDTPEMFIPNVFTPNGDGINDEFYIKTEATRTFRLTVFDRNGRLVFSATSPRERWDGTVRGTPVADGVAYFYEVEVVYLNGLVIRRTGTVTVNR